VAEDYKKYLDPVTLTKVGRLDLIARLVVEGFISGMHKSPYHGFSVEFAEHREYVAGDDLRHLDWKVWSKSDRYYIKQYEEETNLTCYVLLDVSESMKYGSSGVNKQDYAGFIAASLTYLMIQQQDAVGMCMWDNDIRKLLPASSSPAHLKLLLNEMAHEPSARKTRVEQVFRSMAEKLRRRGLVVLISDCFAPVPELVRGLQHFRHRRHEVIVFHVLDEYELTFPFEGNVLFKGLEEWPELLVEPRQLREAYLRAIRRFQRSLQKSCANNRIDYVLVKTSDRLDVVLSAYLASRGKVRTVAAR
jgi:uncharacterized protein (DUF58 family)